MGHPCEDPRCTDAAVGLFEDRSRRVPEWTWRCRRHLEGVHARGVPVTSRIDPDLMSRLELGPLGHAEILARWGVQGVRRVRAFEADGAVWRRPGQHEWLYELRRTRRRVDDADLAA